MRWPAEAEAARQLAEHYGRLSFEEKLRIVEDLNRAVAALRRGAPWQEAQDRELARLEEMGRAALLRFIRENLGAG